MERERERETEDGYVCVYVKLTPNWMKPLEEAHWKKRTLGSSRRGARRVGTVDTTGGVVQSF